MECVADQVGAILRDTVTIVPNDKEQGFSKITREGQNKVREGYVQ